MYTSLHTRDDLSILLIDLPDSMTTTVQVFVKAGSLYETAATNGLSHFLEHMFFKGWKTYTTALEVAETVDAFGGAFNAYTSEDHAAYYIKCANEHRSKSINILADMMVHARFPVDAIEKEKSVVTQEIMMYADDPSRHIRDKRKHRYYGDNNYGRPILGTKETVQSFDQEMLFAHTSSLYTKDNSIIVVAWHWEDQDIVLDEIAHAFAEMPATGTVPTLSFPGIYPDNKHGSFARQTEQAHLICSLPTGITHTDDTRYAATLLSNILWGNMSSRLFHEIRAQEGLCYYIGSKHYGESDHGNLIMYAWLEKERFDYARQRIQQERSRLCKDVSPAELTRAQGWVEGSLAMGLESSDEIATLFGTSYLLKKKIVSIDEIKQGYESVTFDDLQALISTLKTQERYQYWVA